MSNSSDKSGGARLAAVRIDRSGMHVDPADLLQSGPFSAFLDAAAKNREGALSLDQNAILDRILKSARGKALGSS